METKNQANNGLEPMSEEESLIVARELLRQGTVPIGEIVAKTGLSEMRVRGLKGAQVRAEKKLLEAEPTEPDPEPENTIQAAIQPKLKAMVEEEHEEEEDTPSTVPDAIPGTKLDYTTILNMREMLTEKQRPLFDMYIKLAEQKQNQMVRNDGHGNDGMTSTSADEELKRAEAETEREYGKMLRDERMRGRMGYGQKNDNELLRRLDKIELKLENPKGSDPLTTSVQLAKYFSEMSQPKGQGPDQLTVYRSGVSDARENYLANVKSGESNLIDLKLKELDQTERLEMRKIDNAEEHRREGKETEKAIIGLAEKMIGPDGLIGSGVKAVGGWAANRLDKGQNSQVAAPKVIEVTCPRCSKPIKTVEGTRQIVCQNCNTVLGLQNQPQPQPEQAQTQPESTQEPTEEPKQEPEKLSEKPTQSEVIQ